MNLFWTGFCYGAGLCGLAWLCLSIVAVCMMAKAKPEEEFDQERIDKIKERVKSK